MLKKMMFLTVLILCSLQSTLGKSVVVSGERVMPQGVRVSPTAPKNMQYFFAPIIVVIIFMLILMMA